MYPCSYYELAAELIDSFNTIAYWRSMPYPDCLPVVYTRKPNVSHRRYGHYSDSSTKHSGKNITLRRNCDEEKWQVMLDYL